MDQQPKPRQLEVSSPVADVGFLPSVETPDSLECKQNKEKHNMKIVKERSPDGKFFF